MELDLGQWVVIGVSALLIFGYIRGYLYNRQMGRAVTAWLLEGLSAWGPVRPGEKLPGMVTGGRWEIQQAAPPFRQLEVVFLLAPRENPLFWVFYFLQGRRDELLVWASFRSKPEQAVEAARRGDRQFAARLQAETQALEPAGESAGLLLAAAPSANAPSLETVQAFLRLHPGAITRLSLRANRPHLFVRLKLGQVRRLPADEFFHTLSGLGRKPTSTSFAPHA